MAAGAILGMGWYCEITRIRAFSCRCSCLTDIYRALDVGDGCIVSHMQPESAKKFCNPLVTGNSARLTCVIDLDKKTLEYLDANGTSLGIAFNNIQVGL